MPIDQTELKQFMGTSGWHRWSPLFSRTLLTDGAMYVAENGGTDGAYWLMDAIASYQPTLRKNAKLRDAQFWTLTVRPDKSAVLKCIEDTGMAPVVTQEISHTDFDMDEIKLYCMPVGDGKHHTILLPSEY